MPADVAPARIRNRIVGSAEVAPADLVANPNNWRTHPGRQRDALRGSLERVGWVQQVVVNTVTGHLVDGHARLEEAVARGEETVPVLYVELTPEEESLVLASLDPIGAMAGTDAAALDRLLAELAIDDGLDGLLASLGGNERRTGRTDPDDVPPFRAEPGVELGELWALGEHRLLVGDATNGDDVARLVEGEVDVVWTDPPYGVSYVGGTADRLTIANDALTPAATRQLIAAALGLAPLRRGGVFYVAAPAGPAIRAFLEALDDAGWPLRQIVVWVKDRFVLGHSDFHFRHESVLVGEPEPLEHDELAYGWAPGAAHRFLGGRKLDTVWEIPRPSASREHPTMKPVDLVARSLEYSSVAGDRVYDPFAGSGSTLIAAEQLGRRGLAMELDPRYARVVIDRWEAFTGREAELVDG